VSNRYEETGEWRGGGVTRISMISTAQQYYSVGKIKENETVGVCGTYGRKEKFLQSFHEET